MQKLLRLVLMCCACLTLSGLACAQQRLEIIPLQHRSAEQVLPVLLPLVESGGSLTSLSGKLLLRASAENIAQIRRALAAIDTPLRRLMITVRQSGGLTTSGSNAGIQTGRVVIRSDGVMVQGDARANAGNGVSNENAEQRIQTVEGGEASIFLGRSLPLPMRQIIQRPGGVVVADSVQYVDVGSGFTARPDLVGERVVLSIYPVSQRLGAGGVIEGGRMGTEVQGRLGEWMTLGGSDVQSNAQQREGLSYGENRRLQSGSVMIRVDVLD